MENSNNSFDNFETLKLEGPTKNFMLEAAKWGRFLGIVGFIILGIIALISVLLFFFGGSVLQDVPGLNATGGATFGIMYIIIVILYFFPTLYLYNYATKMITAIKGSSQNDFNLSVENLKSMFKFMGIFMIVILSFYAIIIFAAIIGVIASS